MEKLISLIKSKIVVASTFLNNSTRELHVSLRQKPPATTLLNRCGVTPGYFQSTWQIL